MHLDKHPVKKPQPRRYLTKRVEGFAAAFKGVKALIFEEDHAKIHLLATIAVIGAGWYFQIRSWEWVAVTLAMGLVWAMEAMNSAVERLTDLVSPDYHPLAGKAKDLAAGAVLFAAMAAAAVGVLIFWSYVKTFVGEW